MRTIDDFAEIIRRIEAEISKVIVGQKQVIRLFLTCVFGGGHILLEGVPGIGKTNLVRHCAHVLGLKFGRIQFTPDLMPSDVTGTVILSGTPDEPVFKFSPGPIFANMILADEINRATPKTQSALLEAMQERQVTVLGETRPLPQVFVVMATQNPIEMEGTYPLPEAQLDRFMFKVIVPFPSDDELTQILEKTTGRYDYSLNTILDCDSLLEMQKRLYDVPVPEFVLSLTSRLVSMTHPEHPKAIAPVKRYVRYGVSPRGGQSMLIGAKFFALMAGRRHVAREDVLECAIPAMRHRLTLKFEAMAEKISSDDILKEVIKAVI